MAALKSFVFSVFLAAAAIFFTITLGSVVIMAALIGVKDREGGVYDTMTRMWARILLAAAGVKVVLHGKEHLAEGQSYIFTANHVSWFDVLALAATLPRYKFVAKSELFRVPVFGACMRAVGMVSIERDNRKAAFQSYEVAGEKIKAGSSVIVFPEGTRGHDYSIRAFKKGPFVLAIAAGVPVVPTIVHGTIEIMPRARMYIRPGRIDVHLLEPVSTEGLGYDGRDELCERVRTRMAGAMRDIYRVF